MMHVGIAGAQVVEQNVFTVGGCLRAPSDVVVWPCILCFDGHAHPRKTVTNPSSCLYLLSVDFACSKPKL